MPHKLGCEVHGMIDVATDLCPDCNGDRLAFDKARLGRLVHEGRCKSPLKHGIQQGVLDERDDCVS